MTPYISGDDIEKDILRQDDEHRRKYYQRLTRHPLCGDPAHPGCVKCMPEYYKEDEGEEE